MERIFENEFTGEASCRGLWQPIWFLDSLGSQRNCGLAVEIRSVDGDVANIAWIEGTR